MNKLIKISVLFFLFCWSCQQDQDITTPQNVRLFEELTTDQSGVYFMNTLTETEEFNIIEYLYYYNGGGVAVGDINNDGLEDVFFTANQASNQLYLNQGKLQFKDISPSAGIAQDKDWSTGVTMVDINADGWLDIYVCNIGDYKGLTSQNKLYINNKDNTFSERAEEYGLDFKGFANQATFFDYDLDGDLDLYLLSHSVHATDNYQNAKLRTTPNELAGDRLYVNENNHFIDRTTDSGIYSSRIGYGLGVVTSDFNQDGYPDIYVCNDFHENDYLYYNQGDGTFEEACASVLGHTSQFSMGTDAVDVNNDGWMDIITLDMKPADEVIRKKTVGADDFDVYQLKKSFGYHDQFPRNMLQLNKGIAADGKNRFSECGNYAGIANTDWSWSVLGGDYDLDGDSDLFITNGIMRRPNDLDYLNFSATEEIQETASNLELAKRMPSGAIPNYYFSNEGALKFNDASSESIPQQASYSNGAAYADLDNDGDLDLVVNHINQVASIYKNTTQESHSKNYLKVSFQQEGANAQGIGNRVQVFYKNGKQQTKECFTTRGFLSSSTSILHFGIEEVKTIDSLLIYWTDGTISKKEKIPSNQHLILTDADKIDTQKVTSKENSLQFVQQNLIDFIHQENNYDDFDVEHLMPVYQSNLGPCLAKADINKDGWDDIYIGGAKGQRGALFIQQKNGFQASKQAFKEDLNFEDTDAQFFDYDGDGDQDLWVCSGGNELGTDIKYLSDRLYLNDGNGNFQRSKFIIGSSNSSCVAAYDTPNQSYWSIFTATTGIAGRYGVNDKNSLWINYEDRLLDYTNKLASKLERFGTIRDAVWADYDGDGIKDLIVVGEWMPITLFRNRGGHLDDPHYIKAPTNGWWNTIEAADIDQDGDMDFIAGNFGLNTDLHPTTQKPVQLYVQDFDRNSDSDPVMTYYQGDKEYIYVSKDALIKQIVALKKIFLRYDRFAESDFPTLFPPMTTQNALRKSINQLASLYIENKGNGDFQIHKLPLEAQLSSIHSIELQDFNKDGHLDALLAGNQYGVMTKIGKQDANYGTLLLGNGEGNFQTVQNAETGLWLEGQVRDLEYLTLMSGEKILLVGKNNAAVECWQIQKK